VSGSLRPHTSATLLGLLYSTGLRIGEALALNLNDFHSAQQRLFYRRGQVPQGPLDPLGALALSGAGDLCPAPLAAPTAGTTGPVVRESAWPPTASLQRQP
jgi:hypothetical protein